MELAHTIAELRPVCEALRRQYGALALVPTMGALHDGHRALVHAAAVGGAAVVASIFVNPLQFGANEDLSRYPRDEVGDLATLQASGCHLVWQPDVVTMYPSAAATTIDVAGPAEQWEGAARPGHFRGVATVCVKLFGQVRPDRAYFGEKDWQQLQVVRRMVADLHLPLEIIGIPTVREADGLALSSRNRFLTPAERAVAPQLHAVLRQTSRAGATADALADARRALSEAGFALDYLALVDGATLQTAQRGSRLIAAARLGSVRLIDNLECPTNTFASDQAAVAPATIDGSAEANGRAGG
jgi:pantoate--beta-alanine ligase